MGESPNLLVRMGQVGISTAHEEVTPMPLPEFAAGVIRVLQRWAAVTGDFHEVWDPRWSCVFLQTCFADSTLVGTCPWLNEQGIVPSNLAAHGSFLCTL